jgi:carbon-monoxide dehydrogenase small subunit
MLIAAKSLLDREPHPSEERIRFWLAGHLCRCTGYDKIVRAVVAAADRIAGGTATDGTRQAEVMTR